MNIELSNAKDFLDWLKIKAHMNSMANKAKSRLVKRGQVYWCNFGINVGSEMSKTTPRPAVIVQNSIANIKSSNTIVVPVTHDIGNLPCSVPLTPVIDSSGVTILDGQVNTSNVICVSKARLGDIITTLQPSEIKKVDESLAKSLGVMTYYSNLMDKYDKLIKYNNSIKEERNRAQDAEKSLQNTISSLRDAISDFDDEEKKRIQEILDNK